MNPNNRLKRPNPSAFVQYDPRNYYSRLGISPLTPTQEIKAAITRKQNEARKRRRFQGEQKFSEADFEFVELQKIAESFASPKKREEYDRLNPQNALLTVQSSDYDNWFESSSRINLVSAWLVEELGQEKFIPTPESLHIWCPKGPDTELLDFLAQHETKIAPENSTDKSMEDLIVDETLSVDDLENIAGIGFDKKNTKNENKINNNKSKEGE
jgi:hypothetical protein